MYASWILYTPSQTSLYLKPKPSTDAAYIWQSRGSPRSAQGTAWRYQEQHGPAPKQEPRNFYGPISHSPVHTVIPHLATYPRTTVPRPPVPALQRKHPTSATKTPTEAPSPISPHPRFRSWGLGQLPSDSSSMGGIPTYSSPDHEPTPPPPDAPGRLQAGVCF